jgi:hypothetical protein
MRANVRYCVCGHDDFAHEHHRPGTDCALCPAREDCTKFRNRNAVHRQLWRALTKARPERCRNCRYRITDLAGAVRESNEVWCSEKCHDTYMEWWLIR